MRRSRMLRLLVVAVAATALAACNSAEGGASGDDPVIGSDYPRSDTDFWNAYVRYTPDEAKKLGITNLKTTNSENDIAKLTANVQTLLSQGSKGIVMAPQDTAAVAPTLAQLESKKIPVVTIDTRPDTGKVFMVVRADNRAYGEKSCHFLGTKLKGKGKVVMLMGDVASINGRDRTEAFNDCMKKNYPGITVFAEPSKWDGATAANQLQTRLAAHPDIKGIYMQASFALSGTLQVLKQRGLLVPPTDPKHVFIVSNDGIPEELKDIEAGQIDATVSQPADLYAKYGLYYVQQAIAGKTFEPGPTDHGSTIIKVRDGVLEDQLAAPLVTLDGATINGEKTLRFDDKSLWGNNVS
ncbi:simple sugar transport system substrate-binding protein/ribose transport system substrate-binding protein [Cryptosporangium aurantiacum]|uniref:Simple sugar transport system substrate-binding protein/ribose transport system substrate-binding protein n=2 Tax=Cryptosporangium aurantiacum TaxID=134849 RepID=A0A1M7Q418_9ACTN|nr:simple sugar transport system substrate-binding protein/ribose transport system substrate-binding protein [Cryptosporangium aurantiacum]